jgi:hypothetical protein
LSEPKLTPGKRVVAERRKAGIPFDEDDDPDADPYLAEPDDNEWAAVWQIVRPFLPNPSAELEALTRRRVYQAAFHSGYFRNGVHELNIYDKGFLSEGLEKDERYLKAVLSFRKATSEMMFDEEDHDREYKTMISLLDGYLLPRVYRYIQNDKHMLSRAKEGPESAACPKRDLWMARLYLVWRDDCGLDVNHPKLGAFILAACRTHEPKIETVKNFLKKLRAGEIPDPGPTLSARLEVGRIGISS